MKLLKENHLESFLKYKKDFTEIKDRLVEFSKKIGLSVEEFKKLVSRIQKGERESRIAKKEMVEANLRLVISIAKNTLIEAFSSRFNSRREYRFNESCRQV